MILEANKIEKMIGDRLLFSVDQLRISRHDRIGLIGRNGTGKTTLLELLKGSQKPDKGEITTHASIETIPQIKKQKGVHQSIEALETRIDKLEKVEKPKELPTIKMNLSDQSGFKNQTVLQANNISASITGWLLWENASFRIRTGTKTAIIGPNGCGKTTFVRSILQEIDGIQVGSEVKWGYFSQNLDTLHTNQSISQNVKATSVHPDELIRTVLARLLFIGDEIFKKVGILSGGKKVNVAFAKIFLSDMNVLIMDEPTNFLDIEGIEASEHLLSHWDLSGV